MFNQVKSSELDNKKLLMKSRVDTIYLDDWYYSYEKINKNLEKHLLPNVKNIILSKNMLDTSITKTITIENSSAENIYLEDEKNLEGLSINYEDVDKYYYRLEIKYSSNFNCNLKQIKIYNKDKFVNIDLEPNTSKIILAKNGNEIFIRVIDGKKATDYYIDELCNKREEKIRYTIDSTDLDNGVLDLRKYLDYKEIQTKSMDINILIIDQKILNNISLLNIDRDSYLYIISASSRIKVQNLRIIEDNDMKLVPIDKTFSLSGRKVIGYQNKKFLYIDGYEDEVLIYLDSLGNVKILSRNELLKSDEVEYVKFYFNRRYMLRRENTRQINLILLKYKNEIYKVINFDKTYEIKESFTRYLYEHKLDFVPEEYRKYLKENDWFKVFDDNLLDNDLFNRMINSYKQYKNYIMRIKEYGLTEEALYYLKHRNITEITNPKTEINFDLNKEEIDLLNKLGENYKKVLKK